MASCVCGIPSGIWDNGVAFETSGVSEERMLIAEAAWLWQMSGQSCIATQVQGTAGNAAKLATTHVLWSSGDICTSELDLGNPGSDLISQWDFIVDSSVLEYVQ